MSHERVQLTMIILALLVVPLLIIEQQATDPAVLLVVWSLNLLIWLAFVAEYLHGIRRAPDRWQYAREHWVDLAIILLSPPLYLPEGLQAVRSLRALRIFQIGRLGRLLRLLRLMRLFAVMARAWSSSRRLLAGHSFGYVLLSSGIFVVGGGALFVLVEGRGLTLLDGIWWAVATLTTVGYGDVYPQTDWGRLIALFVIIMGLGLMATLTANIAAHFVEGEKRDENSLVLERLDTIAARLDRLESRLTSLEGSTKGGDAPPPS